MLIIQHYPSTRLKIMCILINSEKLWTTACNAGSYSTIKLIFQWFSDHFLSLPFHSHIHLTCFDWSCVSSNWSSLFPIIFHLQTPVINRFTASRFTCPRLVPYSISFCMLGLISNLFQEEKRIYLVSWFSSRDRAMTNLAKKLAMNNNTLPLSIHLEGVEIYMVLHSL